VISDRKGVQINIAKHRALAPEVVHLEVSRCPARGLLWPGIDVFSCVVVKRKWIPVESIDAVVQTLKLHGAEGALSFDSAGAWHRLDYAQKCAAVKAHSSPSLCACAIVRSGSSCGAIYSLG
jgi:hypothetical protein